MPLLGVIGEPFQYVIKMAGFFPGGDHGPEQRIEHVRKQRQAIGEVMTFNHPRPYRQHHRLVCRLLALIRHRFQCLFDWQRGPDQGRQLARDQRQIGGIDANPFRCFAAGLNPPGCLGNFIDFERRQRLLAQLNPNLPSSVGFEHAFFLSAVGVEGDVFKRGHVDSRLVVKRGLQVPRKELALPVLAPAMVHLLTNGAMASEP